MRKTHTLIFTPFLMAGSCLAQEQQVLTRRIFPEDIVQDSIQSVQVATNRFVVRWTYTEMGSQRRCWRLQRLRGREGAHPGWKL